MNQQPPTGSNCERADLYHALAEALAEPQDWMCLPGRDWPLFELASKLMPNSSGLPSLELIQGEALSARQARYGALQSGSNGQLHTWLYESAYLTGRILGEATFSVAKCYAGAGLQVNGSELPDSAALELAFLAHLAAGPDGFGAEKCFLMEHAALWLPALGQTLAHGADPVYAAIGQLLSDWLNRVSSPPPVTVTAQHTHLPFLSDSLACSLCGFCAQRCPTGALSIRETASKTALVLQNEDCTGCGRCARACEMQPSLIRMRPRVGLPTVQKVVLRHSERLSCKKCGEPTVSRAELDFVIQKIGHPDWLDNCPRCRIPAQIYTGDKS